MISALSWIPRGKANPNPDKYDINEEDIKLLKEAGVDVDAADDELAEYNLDAYDDEPEDIDVDDEYIPEGQEELLADDLDDIDDLTIRPTDGVIIAAVARDEEDEDISHLDVYIFEEDKSNLYVHHDLMLSSFPLAVAWIDNLSTKSGNYAAIGSFEPGIEIWDLDMIDVVEPTVVLGGYTDGTGEDAPQKKKGKKKSKQPKHVAGSHTGAVMALNWNLKARNILASGSADTTVKLWDLNTAKCLQTFTHHKAEVQSVEWHLTEPSILMTGSYDKTAVLLDARTNDASTYQRWKLPADCEVIQWNIRSPQHFVVSTENGELTYYDVMRGGGGAPVWNVHAHTKAASCVALNPFVSLMVSGSLDKSIKLWDISGAKPALLDTITWDSPVFSVSFYGDSPNLLAVGGERSGVKILDLLKHKDAGSFFTGEKSDNKTTNYESMLIEKLSLSEDEDSDDSDHEDIKPKKKSTSNSNNSNSNSTNSNSNKKKTTKKKKPVKK